MTRRLANLRPLSWMGSKAVVTVGPVSRGEIKASLRHRTCSVPLHAVGTHSVEFLVAARVNDGGEVTVQREDAHGDRQVYVSVECECATDPEHRLQIVFPRSHSVTEAGLFDSHLTTSPLTSSTTDSAEAARNT
ncbi:DUF6985 domain-containing protein [Streptomyces sp. NPDC057062]|uniref:DUF6985 domain-containing protein n=1 Tax=Streptomyces sp. NPDC057062 TaxID=3346011 RepID=UPI003626CFE0